MEALNRQALRVLKLFGNDEVKHVSRLPSARSRNIS